MFFKALATDYDGTLAADGAVSERTIAALEQLRASGRKLILVTGRELPDLRSVFARLDLFDRVVAENGALLVRPETGEEVPLASPPPPSFVARLKERRVAPFSQGRVVVATRVPHDEDVLAVIRELGLELQIVFNKGAVMVLPPGINKASGLAVASAELGLSPLNIVAVGDAENDHAFLRACGCGVAVENALEMLKEAADWVTAGARGDGVAELAERLCAGDLADLDLGRRVALSLGAAPSGTELRLDWRGERLLVAGSAPAAKAWIAPLLDEMRAGGLQVVVIDRTGHYRDVRGLTVVGEKGEMPKSSTALELLETAAPSLAVDLSLASQADASAFAAELLAKLEALRREKGRPHWLLLDRAEELLPPDAAPVAACIYSTPALERMPRGTLASLDAALFLAGAEQGLRALADAQGLATPTVAGGPKAGEAVLWRPASSAPPVTVRPSTARSALRSG